MTAIAAPQMTATGFDFGNVPRFFRRIVAIYYISFCLAISFAEGQSIIPPTNAPLVIIEKPHPRQTLNFTWTEPSSPGLAAIILLAETNASGTNRVPYAQQQFPAPATTGALTNLDLSATNYFYGQSINSNGIKSTIAYGCSVSGIGYQTWTVLGFSPDLVGWDPIWSNNTPGFFRLGHTKTKIIIP